MSLAGQWDAVNGEVLRYPAVEASMDPDHQLERHAYYLKTVRPTYLVAKHQTVQRRYDFRRHSRNVCVTFFTSLQFRETLHSNKCFHTHTNWI